MNFVEQQEQFIKFIKSYDSYLLPAYMIAQNNDDKTIINVKKIGSQFKLYSLDNLCKTRPIFWKNEINITPKTTDAIWFKKGKKGAFFIYLIEFKGDKIKNKTTKNRFKEYLDELEEKRIQALNPIDEREIRNVINKITPFFNKYSDSLLNSLILKPLETVTTSLPLIYEDYYNSNKYDSDVKWINVVDFLKEAIIKYYVVVFPDDNPEIDENNQINEYNPIRNRLDANTIGNTVVDVEYDIDEDKELTESYEKNLNSYYERYKKAKIINDYEFMPTDQFNMFVKEIFEESY